MISGGRSQRSLDTELILCEGSVLSPAHFCGRKGATLSLFVGGDVVLLFMQGIYVDVYID